jgi:DNA-directed RNA polymerase specialized sigma24 family protein
MVPAERDPLEVQADALLTALPRSQRRGILLPDALRRRQRQEKPLIAPVLATRPGGGDVPGDSVQVYAEWEICERIVTAAGLTNEERACYLLHTQHGWSDREIAELYGIRRATVNLRRQLADAKIKKAVSAQPSEAA